MKNEGYQRLLDNSNQNDQYETIDEISVEKQRQVAHAADPPRKSKFPPSQKKKIQITFKDIFIKTIPKVKKCCVGKDYEVPKERVIINRVSGSIKPGEFLAIIGASGKIKTLDIYNK